MRGVTSKGEDPLGSLLRRSFVRSSRRVLAASALSTLGCSVNAGDGGDPGDAMDVVGESASAEFAPLSFKPSCDEAGWHPLRALAPSISPNHLAWRQGITTRDQVGVRCEGAEDPRVCEAAVRSANVHDPPVGWNVLSTTGGEVEVWQGEERIRALLGQIDTADEALMLAAVHGYVFHCYGPPNDAEPDAVQLNTFAQPGGWELWLNPSFDGCGTIHRYRLFVSSTGELTQLSRDTRSTPCPQEFVGRRSPMPDVPAPRRYAGNPVGNRLAVDARNEAASVGAFELLAKDLARHGAPLALRRRALDAADDEARHARVTAALARRFDGDVQAPTLGRAPTRSLADVTLDNAVEGCVGETFSALVTTFQAIRCPDARVRATLAGIAADEIEHAAFSWRLHQWATQHLSGGEAARIRAAQRAAVDRLRSTVVPPHPLAAVVLGLPSAVERRHLLDLLEVVLLG